MHWRKLGKGYYKATGPSGATYWADGRSGYWELRQYGVDEKLTFGTLAALKQQVSERESFLERQVLASRGD